MNKCKYQIDMPLPKNKNILPSKPKCKLSGKSCIASKFCAQTGNYIINDRVIYICDKYDGLVED